MEDCFLLLSPSVLSSYFSPSCYLFQFLDVYVSSQFIRFFVTLIIFFPSLFLSIRTYECVKKKGRKKSKKEETVKMDENVISQRIHMPRLSCRIHSCNRKKMDDTGAKGLAAVHH